MTLSQALTPELGDPSRVLAGVMSGVGFLGGGVILARHGRVQGVTTAAMIGCLGSRRNDRSWPIWSIWSAIAITIIVLTIVAVVDYLEERRIPEKGERAGARSDSDSIASLCWPLPTLSPIVVNSQSFDRATP